MPVKTKSKKAKTTKLKSRAGKEAYVVTVDMGNGRKMLGFVTRSDCSSLPDELARDGDVRTDYGVRFAGIPSGHEFSTLIHDLILVSGRDSGLSPETRAFLKGLEKPVHLQVFVTPT